MSDPLIVGIDPALTETGLADADGVTHRCILLPPKRAPRTEHERLCAKIDTIRDWCSRYTDGASLIVIERPFIHHKHPGNVEPLYSLQYALLRRCVARNQRVVRVAPSQLKIYACAHGHASKEMVHDAALGLGWAGPTHPGADGLNSNESDAFVCRAVGHHIETGEPLMLSQDPEINRRRRETASDLARQLR